MVKITLKKSSIGMARQLRKTVVALGLRKVGASVIRQDIPAVRGMIHRVHHLLKVEEVKE